MSAGARPISGTAADDGEEDTRDRLLTAARDAFTELGFERATVRDITDLAQTNVSAVNYHFGSKEELLGCVLDSMMAPYTAARVTALDDCLSHAAPDTPTLEQVVEAFVRPIVKESRDASGARPLIRLLMEARARPHESTRAMFVRRVDPSIYAFIDALQICLPHLSREHIFWRYNFSIGAAMQILIDSDPAHPRLRQLSGGLCDTDDDSNIIVNLVAFISNGMRAP